MKRPTCRGLLIAVLLISNGAIAQPAGDSKSAVPNSFYAEAAAKPSSPLEGAGWKSLFDGHSLNGWQVTDFTRHAAAHVESGLLVIESGTTLTGVNWTNDVPKVNYEIALDAMKVKGGDFFCGLTFPVTNTWCSLILGGWGGDICGISSIDDEDASENETSRRYEFDTNRWYRVRVRVTNAKIEAWLDDKQIVDFEIKHHQITVRYGEIQESEPLGIATYQTVGAMRNIKVRLLEPEAPKVLNR